MEKKFVVVDGQTFISAAAVHDFVSAPIEAVEPEQGAIGVTSLFVDGLQSVSKTNVGKPRVWIHADGRLEINEDVDWADAESVLHFIQGVVSETDLAKSFTNVSQAMVRSGVFAALDPKPGHPQSLEDRVKVLEARVLDLQAGMGDREACEASLATRIECLSASDDAWEGRVNEAIEAAKASIGERLNQVTSASETQR